MNKIFSELLKIMDNCTVTPNEIIKKENGREIEIYSEVFGSDFLAPVAKLATRENLEFSVFQFTNNMLCLTIQPAQ